MQVKTKIIVGSFFSFAMVVGIVLSGWLYTDGVEEERYQESVLEGHQALWGSIVLQQYSKMKSQSKRLRRNKRVLKALFSYDSEAVQRNGRYDYNGLSSAQFITNLVIVDASGKTIFSAEESRPDQYREIAQKVLDQKMDVKSLAPDAQGNVELLFAFPLYFKRRVVGVGIFSKSFKEAIADYAKIFQANSYVVTPAGTRSFGENSPFYETLLEMIPRDVSKKHLIYMEIRGEDYIFTSFPLYGGEQQHLASVVSFQNDTKNFQRIKQARYSMYGAISIVFLLTLAGWFFSFRRIFAPLDDTARVVTLNSELEEEVEKRTIQLTSALEEAKSASRAKSTFLANMSHELRTPLNAIIGYSGMLKEDIEDMDPEEINQDLERITNSGTHLLSVIQDILDVSKIEAGKMMLCQEVFSLQNMLETLQGMTIPLAEKKNNTFVLESVEDLGKMYGDSGKIRQALLNLLSNACKFTKEGTVTLKVFVDQDPLGGTQNIVFVVKDTGCGIPKEKQGNLFNSFAQADSSTTKEYGGTGLGLVISKQFCELMGGSVSLESEEGEGTTFTISLPLYRSIEQFSSGIFAKSSQSA